ncbi:MAG: hypothetical protein ACYS6W_10905 [Planctomycetota bacterium]|jgi:hypothetical protein
MKQLYILLAISSLALLISSVPGHAVVIGYYPGLEKLIEQADAIVILRIDRHLTGFGSPTFYSTHECYIYQTLKGDIKKNTRINLQLMDTEAGFATPYAWGSTHLMFLMKKATDDEPTEYRTTTSKGAQIRLSPLGHEKPPKGRTIREKIKNLIKDTLAYWKKEHEKNQKFLKTMLGKQGMAEPAEKTTRQEPAARITELLRRADYVGFVIAAPMVSAPQSQWKQRLFLYSIDSLKGDLNRDPASKQFPWVYAGRAGRTKYSTWLSQKAECLVFLRYQEIESKKVLATIAAFPVEYRPDTAGRVVGSLFAGHANGKTLNAQKARNALQILVKGGHLPDEKRKALDSFLRAAVLPEGVSSQPASVPFEERFREAKKVASSIRISTTRKDIEKIFPQEDYGISGPSSTRYYLGSEVMVEVPFDQTAGAWKQENKVNGRIKVYRSRMHVD